MAQLTVTVASPAPSSDHFADSQQKPTNDDVPKLSWSHRDSLEENILQYNYSKMKNTSRLIPIQNHYIEISKVLFLVNLQKQNGSGTG